MTRTRAVETFDVEIRRDEALRLLGMRKKRRQPRESVLQCFEETLREIQAEKGFAILLVEHDVELVAHFTERTYVLDFGTLIAAGPTAATLAEPAVRHAYLGSLELDR